MVYIKEAHSSDLWQMAGNIRRYVVFADPKSVEERVAGAGTCLTKLSVRIPALIDDMQNSTELAYTAWPDRLYVIDRDGRIRYKGEAGPFGFDAELLEAKLKQMAVAR